VYEFGCFFGGTTVINSYLLVNGEANSAAVGVQDERTTFVIPPQILAANSVRPVFSYYGSPGLNVLISVLKPFGGAPTGSFTVFNAVAGANVQSFTGGPGVAWAVGEPFALQVTGITVAGSLQIAAWWADSGL
jgi:hypothetical protein